MKTKTENEIFNEKGKIEKNIKKIKMKKGKKKQEKSISQ